jgi:predicted enzyme related to lactoylglutathione lyase
MPTVDRHPPGAFCWIELGTTDITSARAFYGGLFGWTAEDAPTPDHPYTFWMAGGRQAGAAFEMDDKMRQQAPPNWMIYVAVENAGNAMARARSLGGDAVMGPLDVMEEGRLAILRDPGGAVFSVWQPKRHGGVQVHDEPNTLCWCELATRDRGKAIAFYRDLFQWTCKESPDYVEIHNQGKPVGGILQMDERWGGMPPYWCPYFMVTDCDERAAKAKELGGAVKAGPIVIPQVGRFAVIADPQGAIFQIIQLAGGH